MAPALRTCRFAFGGGAADLARSNAAIDSGVTTYLGLEHAAVLVLIATNSPARIHARTLSSLTRYRRARSAVVWPASWGLSLVVIGTLNGAICRWKSRNLLFRGDGLRDCGRQDLQLGGLVDEASSNQNVDDLG